MTNEVVLRGRIPREPEEKVLPSGDLVAVVRLVVARPEQGRPGVDWMDCAVWSRRLRRVVAAWHADDVVEVQGALRRRFYRQGGAPSSLVEVEVHRARLIRRARSA